MNQNLTPSLLKPILRVLSYGVLFHSVSACALTSKSDPLVPRFFSPEASANDILQATKACPAPQRAALDLRLGYVGGSNYLREKIAYRDSSFELGYYDDRRWTERPNEYLRRKLARTLFEECALNQIISFNAPTLEAELISFETLRKPHPGARAQIAFVLRDERRVYLQRTVTTVIPLRDVKNRERSDAEVAALAQALDQAVDGMVAQVVAQLARNNSEQRAAQASEGLSQ